MASLKLPDRLEDDALRALALVEKLGRAAIIGHYDADGISSAAVVCAALRRLGIEFSARNIQVVTPEVMRGLVEPEEGVVFLTDLGSSMASMLSTLRTPSRGIVIVDHHPPDAKPEGLVQINAHIYGIDGTFDACSSTIAYAMALAWDEANVSLFRQAIIGCIGDRQASQPQGLNRTLIDHAVARKAAELREEVPLGPGPLKDEIAASHDPYFRRLSTPEKAAEFLLSIGVPQDESFARLEPPQKRLLCSMLIIELAESGADPEAVSRALRLRYVLPDGEFADHLARIVDASGRMGDTGTGLAAALGSREARKRAETLASEFRGRLIDLVHRLDEGTQKGGEAGLRQKGALQWFESEDASLVGTVAECALAFLGRHDRPVFGFAPGGEKVKGSARGNRKLVEAGLDLGEACSKAAGALGGNGGGHSIASGITLPAGRVAEFLDLAEAIVAKQLRLAPTAANSARS